MLRRIGLVVTSMLVAAVLVVPSSGASPLPPPELSVNPATGDFGSLTVGTSADQVFTLTNPSFSINGIGGAVAVITEITLSDSTFTLTQDACTGRELFPGDSCSVNVKFSPLIVGPVAGQLAFNATYSAIAGEDVEVLSVPPQPIHKDVALAGAGVAAVVPTIAATTEAATTTTTPAAAPTVAAPVIAAKRPGVGPSGCVAAATDRKSISIPFTLTEAASVKTTVSFKRRSSQNVNRCQAASNTPTPGPYIPLRRKTVQGVVGNNILKVSLMKNGRRLPAGRYLVSLLATNTAGARSTVAQTYFLLVDKAR